MAKLVCTIELSKTKGVTITVADAEGKVTQTVTMDGTTLCLKVAGDKETSTWTQTDAAIKVACKDFEITASNAIKCTAQKTITFESKDGNTSLSAGAKLEAKAKKDVEISGANAKLEASKAAKLVGKTVAVAGTQSVNIESKTEVKMSGAQIGISAKAKLDAKSSGMANFQGSMTTIKGAMIKAG